MFSVILAALYGTFAAVTWYCEVRLYGNKKKLTFGRILYGTVFFSSIGIGFFEHGWWWALTIPVFWILPMPVMLILTFIFGSVDQRVPPTRNQLEEFFAYGENAPKGEKEAFQWNLEQAEQGNAFAQCFLGCFYADGLGVTKDEAQAVAWFRKAAEQGNIIAQGYLGDCYARGAGVPKDEAQAVAWYRSSAEQGNPNAQGSLGFAYYKAAGVPKNIILAYMWSHLAAARGISKCEELRDKIVKEMTPAEIIEGQRAYREWKPMDPKNK